MPTKKKFASATPRELPSIPQELIDHLIKGPMSAEAIQDASMALKKALIERAHHAMHQTRLGIDTDMHFHPRRIIGSSSSSDACRGLVCPLYSWSNSANE